MTRIQTWGLALTLMACGASAVAAESQSDFIRKMAPRGITAAFYGCIDKAEGDHVAEAACLTDEKSTQDKRLNTVYKTLQGKLDGSEKEKLVAAERAWLAFRDRNVSLESAIYGDESVADLQLTQNDVFALCERANALQTYLDVVDNR